MMRVLFIAIPILLLGTSALAQSDWRQRSREPDALQSEYGVLLDNNIFLRNRGRQPSPPTSRPAAPPLTREQTLILTGIVLEEGQFRAYFEDTRSNSIVRVAEGDEIANGTIDQIMIDAVAYETADGLRWIDIGHDLTASIPQAQALGYSAGSSTSPDGSTQPTTGSDGAPSAPSDPAVLSIEERLRQRRLRSINSQLDRRPE